jgi:hypothetical protein
VFYKDGTRHLISGAYSGGFFGFRYVPTVKNLPDLMPTSIQPILLKTNETNNITTTVINAGNASAGAFNVSLKRDGTVIGMKAMDSLSVGEERSVNFSYMPTSPGLTFNLTATVDPENAIEESNATNNNLTVQVRTIIADLPDLIPTSIQPTMLKTNATNNITTTVINAGAVSAGAFNVSLKRDGTVIGMKAMDSLSVGEERSVIFSYMPTSPGLTFNLTATVDPENAIEESNATNNNLTVLARTTNTTVHEAFDTGPGTYPSIAGTHYGKIIPEQDITVNKTYTYPCAGTGGHSEYVKIWDETTGECVVAEWDGYSGDYHNLSFNRTQTLREGVVYSYIIETGSYPQIIHAPYKQLSNGNITCTRFEDANGRVYHNRLPAIRLFYE